MMLEWRLRSGDIHLINTQDQMIHQLGYDYIHTKYMFVTPLLLPWVVLIQYGLQICNQDRYWFKIAITETITFLSTILLPIPGAWGWKSTSLQKKVEKLNDFPQRLQDGRLITEQCSDLVNSKFSGTFKDLLKNEASNATAHAKGRLYTEEAKKFAATLHFYSPVAYKDVRGISILPHA